MKLIKNILVSFLVGFISAIGFSAESDTIVLRDFRPGLFTDADSTSIPDTASPDLLNVDVEDGSIRTRGGSVAVSSSSLGGFGTAVRFLYEYVEPDGDRWLISASSATIFKSNNGGQNNSVLTSTHGFTSSSDYCAVTAFGKMRLTDGTTNWITYNGTTLEVDTGAPKGFTCAFFGDRVWTSTGSMLYATNINDVTDWVVTASTGDEDAISQPVRLNDGQGITCLNPFKDRLLVFKAQSLDAYILNEDGISYQLVPISNHIGTSHCNSVVEREGDIVFLGPDAFYKYSPGTASYKGYAGEITRISDNISPTVSNIQQLDANSVFHIETGESDFSTGNLAQMSASISPGDLVLSTWTVTDDTTSDFNLFTSSSSVNIVDGRVYLSTNNADVLNNSFENGTGGCVPSASVDNWTFIDIYPGNPYPMCHSISKVYSGTYSIFLGGNTATYKYAFFDSAGNVLQVSSNTQGASGSWVQRSTEAASLVGRFVRFGFLKSVFATPQSIYSDVFLYNGGLITWYDINNVGDPYVDLIEGGRSTISSGTITGQSRDTGIPTPLWRATTPTYTENGHSITFQTAASSDGVVWDSTVSWTPGSAPTSASKEYIRWSAVISTGGTTNGASLPFVESIPLAARASTGTYQGSHFATSVTSFGAVDIVETLNSGQTAYAIYTDTDTSATFSNSSTWISSQTVTDGTVPTLSPNSYAFLFASATITSGTSDPTISEISIALTGGNQAPVWSEFHKGTYLTSLSTFSSSGNDSILLYDKNSAWTPYDHNFYCMKRILSGSILGGSNTDGKIYRFRDTTLHSDGGLAINSYWRSKDFDFGLPVGEKTMLRYYVTADYTLDSDAVFYYGVNRGSATSATLDLDSTTGFLRKTIIPTSLAYQKGTQHFFRISNLDAEDSFVIRSVGMKVRSETEP